MCSVTTFERYERLVSLVFPDRSTVKILIKKFDETGSDVHIICQKRPLGSRSLENIRVVKESLRKSIHRRRRLQQLCGRSVYSKNDLHLIDLNNHLPSYFRQQTVFNVLSFTL